MRTLALALLVIVIFTSSASAQRLPFYNPENSYFELKAFCEPGAPTLVKVWIHVTPEFESPAQTVRITRDVSGEDDSPSVIGTINLEGLAPGEHNFEFVDPDPVDMLAAKILLQDVLDMEARNP